MSPPSPRNGVRKIHVGPSVEDADMPPVSVQRYPTQDPNFRKSVAEVHSMVMQHFMKQAAQRKYLVDPRSKRMKQWDLVMIMLLLFTAIVTPAEVSFMAVSINALFFINRIVDCCFLWDMSIQFRLMYEATDGTMICSWRKSTRRYLRGWFLLDLISVIPFDVIAFVMEPDVITSSVKESSVGSARILRNVRLLRLLKLLRIVRANRILTRWESRLGISYSTLSLYKFGISLITLAHWGACAWYVAASVEDDPSCEHRENINALTGVVVTGCPSWVTQAGVRGKPFGDRYMWSFYFAVTVLFSGGPAGDMMPQNMTERATLTFLIAVSGSIYAYVIGAVCGIISQQDMATKIFRQSMDHLNLYMSENRLPPSMRVRMRGFFLRAREMHRDKFYHSTLQIMSPTLRGEVLAMTQGDWISKVPFFSGAPPKEQRDFFSALVLCLKTELFAQQDMVVQEGELCQDMYIIQRGLVACLGRVLSRGRLIGHDMILSRWKWRRQYSARALTFVEVQKITNEDLAVTLDQGDFPHTRHNIKRSALRLCLCRAVLLAAARAKARAQAPGAERGGTLGTISEPSSRKPSYDLVGQFSKDSSTVVSDAGLDGADDSNVLQPDGVGRVNPAAEKRKRLKTRRESAMEPQGPCGVVSEDGTGLQQLQQQLTEMQQQMAALAEQGAALKDLMTKLRPVQT